MNRRHTLLRLLVFLLVLTVAGCGQKGRVIREDGRIQIQFWHSMSGNLGDVMDRLIARFNESNPRVYVDAQFMGEYNILNQKLIASVAADIPPNLAQVFESWTDELREEGVIAPLDPLIDGPGGFDRTDMVPALLRNVTVEGKIWSLPCNKSIQVLYYNKDLFRQAGLDPERPPATWDEFIEMAGKLTIDKDGDGRIDQWGVGFAPDSWWFMNLTRCFGGEIVTPEGDRALLSSPAAIRAGQFMQDLIRKYKVAIRCTGREHQNKFSSGEVAMFIGTVVSKVFIEAKLEFPLGMAHLPRGEKASSILSGTNIAIFDKGDTAEVAAAFEFIRWFTASEQTLEWSAGTTYMPVRLSALSSDLAADYLTRDPNLKVSLTLPENLDYEPRSSQWFECRNLLGLAVERMIVAMEDPQKVLPETVERMDAILRHAKYR